MKKNVVAIVGRPNVGKSSLFNRLIQKRKSIVDSEPGITRDRIYDKVEWMNDFFFLIDTGGFTTLENNFQKDINLQVEIAIEEANIILMIVNCIEGIQIEDYQIAKKLIKSKKTIILVVNKTDNNKLEANVSDFYQLGFMTIIKTSVIHGIGIGDLLDAIVSFTKKNDSFFQSSIPKIAIVGKPNVGKSSLINSITKENRVIVSEIPGTTRDAIDIQLEFNQKNYIFIDTAGIRKRGKIFENIEKYSLLRTNLAIEEADICLLLLDPFNGLTEQDERIAGLVLNLNKPIILVVNKWDLFKKETNTQNEVTKQIEAKFRFLKFASIIFISAKYNQKINNLFLEIDSILKKREQIIKPSQLNEIINKIQILRAPPTYQNHQLKIYYSVYDNKSKIPIFILFVNNPSYSHFSYLRFIENQLRSFYDFQSIPIKIILRKKSNL